MRFNRGLKIVLSSFLAFGAFSSLGDAVSADSGVSALPSKDSALHQYYYKKYAPKKQTTYKHFQTVTKKVSDIKKENNQMIALGNDLVMGGTFGGILSGKKKFKLLKFSTLSAALVGTGVVVYAGGRASQIKYNKIEDGAVVKSKIYFKWTNASKLEYSVKIVSHVEYKRKVISKKNTYVFNKSL